MMLLLGMSMQTEARIYVALFMIGIFLVALYLFLAYFIMKPKD
jgi:phosphotransferase system  glucose/maltose/N-acetylglucosamine-specific IIC component